MAWAVDLTIDIALEVLTGGAWTGVMAAKGEVAGGTKAAKTGAKGIKAVARDGVTEIVEHADDLGGAARQAAKHVDDATTNAITQGRRGMNHADNMGDGVAQVAKAVPDDAKEPKNILDRIASFFIHNDVTKALGIHDELTAFANKLGLKACFAAGTPLLTPTGSKPIEEFKVGDVVLSRSEFDPNGLIEAKVVEELFRRYAPILHVHVGGQVIRTTGEHPFYVEGKGWIPAHAMVASDRLLSHDGRWIAVEEVFDTGEWETVYNMRVADWHTYFVGNAEWGFSVWCHNLGCDDLLGILERQGILTPQQRKLLATDPEFLRLYQSLADEHGPYGALRVIADDLNRQIDFSTGTFVTMTFRRADFTIAEQNLIEFKYAIANFRSANGLENPIVGANIQYRYQLSKRFERHTVQPQTKSSRVKISDGYQVDEFVPRHSNGPQDFANQWHMPNDNYLNNTIGPMEVVAARMQGLQAGQRFSGWRVVWID